MRESRQPLIFSLFIFSIFYGKILAANPSSPCEDWEAYKDEKCFKIIDETLRNYDDAVKTCIQQDNSATLVIIRSKDEQDFFSNLLFKTHKVVDTVWIGAKYSSNKFKWADDTDVSFTNWAVESPSNTDDKACVQMIPDGSSMGKWADEPCNKKNLVVCQKMQNWSISRLQKTLLDARKELQDSLEDVKKKINNHESTVQSKFDNLYRNPVPIGFIYVQLPDQPEPQNLWPTVQWVDVTTNYSGLFFRAEGGDSQPFGKLQNGNSPFKNIDSVTFSYTDDGYFAGSSVKLPNSGSGSQAHVWTGSWKGPTYGALTFGVTENKGEVRPINKAVRIWKRSK